jgi:predicted dehydrogenase
VDNHQSRTSPSRPFTRRRFLKGAATLAAGATLAPAARADRSPNDRLSIAFIGVGGRGAANLAGLSRENAVVALCDLDDRRAAEAYKQFPQARRFRDYRKMLDDLGKTIDAVSISTPDHTHAVAAMEAIRRGLHVYCEKPLAHSIGEVRALRKAAREKGVVTQLGNQGHATDSIRKLVEMVRDGAIGKVHTVHAGCSSSYSKVKLLPKMAEVHPVPPELDWDLWLGPVPARPYHPAYLPGTWRGWKAFGSGVIGDWICHVVDPSYWALDLGAPRTIQAVNVGDYDPVAHAETFPAGCTIKFEFPEKGVTLFWYTGLDVPRMPRPEGLEEKKEMPSTGALLLGEKGAILHGSHGASNFAIVGEAKMKAYTPPPPSLPRVGDPYKDFAAAIREKRKAGSDFAEYGGPLTEMALLGILSMGFPGRTLTWDAPAGRFTDCDEANRKLSPVFREGWSL